MTRIHRTYSMYAALLAAMALSGPLAAKPAAALPMQATGVTELYFSSLELLECMGFDIDTIGDVERFQSSELPSPHYFFPVSSFDPDEAAVAHEGSGLEFSAAGAMLGLENFSVLFESNIVTADVSMGGQTLIGVEVFSMEDCSVINPCVGFDGVTVFDGFELSLTAAAADAFYGEFGSTFMGGGFSSAQDLVGLTIGVGNSFVQVVPEPSTALLLGLGLSALGARRRGIA